MAMTFDEMQTYLENAGYNIAGMDAEEVDVLAEAESFRWYDAMNAYKFEEAN